MYAGLSNKNKKTGGGWGIWMAYITRPRMQKSHSGRHTTSPPQNITYDLTKFDDYVNFFLVQIVKFIILYDMFQ